MKFSPAKLKAIRDRNGYTVSEAARRAGMVGPDGVPHHASWLRLENGGIDNPTLDTLSRAAAAVGAKLADILDE